jgi:hypothetical protein
MVVSVPRRMKFPKRKTFLMLDLSLDMHNDVLMRME